MLVVNGPNWSLRPVGLVTPLSGLIHGKVNGQAVTLAAWRGPEELAFFQTVFTVLVTAQGSKILLLDLYWSATKAIDLFVLPLETSIIPTTQLFNCVVYLSSKIINLCLISCWPQTRSQLSNACGGSAQWSEG